MSKHQNASEGFNGLILAASLVAITWGIYQAQSVLVLILVAIFLSVIGAPPVNWLTEKRVPSALAVIAVLAAMIAALVVIGGVVGTSLAGFSDSMPSYQKKIGEDLAWLRGELAARGIVINDSSFMGYINPSSVMNLTAALFSGLTSVLSSLFLILLTVMFTLFEVSSFPGKLRALLDDPEADFSKYTRFFRDINRYMLMKTGLGAATGILVGMWLSILGIDFPFLWGFLTFLLNFVPSLGIIIAAVPAVLLALVQYGAGRAGLTALGYFVINFIIGTLIEPKVVGRTAGLSTLVVFLSLVVWGNLLGLIGMVLCIPFTMTLKFLLEQNDRTRGIAVLLGPSDAVRHSSGSARNATKTD